METSRGDFFKAFNRWEHITRQHNAFVHSEGKDTEIASVITASVPRGLYEHWKSKQGDLKFYVVFGAGFERDVHTPLVTGAALYGPYAGILSFWHLIHERRGFLTPIDRDIYRGPRFSLVSELMLVEIATLLKYVEELTVIRDPIQFRLRAGGFIKKDLMLY